MGKIGRTLHQEVEISSSWRCDMQAMISRSGRVGQTPLVVLALGAGLALGGVGGYSINGLLRPSLMTPSVIHVQTNASDTNLAASAARHAATERAEALDGTDLAASMARHATTERAEAGTVIGFRP
jgi:hypothetical protein